MLIFLIFCIAISAHHGDGLRLHLLQRLEGRFARSAVMPDGRQITQRLKKCRGQQQHKHGLTKAELATPGAKIQRTQQVKADIDGHHGHTQGREQLQHGG